MLESLYIKDFALIEELRINFSEGLNILTGETGAGKTIIIEALQIALGERASAELIRSGATRTQVDAVFRLTHPSKEILNLLSEYGIDLIEDLLILSRVIYADGRSRAWISGRPVSINALMTLGNELVDFHGQYEHQSLLQPQKQLELLDLYAGVYDIRLENSKKFLQLQKIEKEIQEILETKNKQTREWELLQHELEEIEKINPQPGEDTELKNKILYSTNLENLKRNAREVVDLLSNSDFSIISHLHRVHILLDEMKKCDELFTNFSHRLGEILCELQELSRECLHCANKIELSEEELEQLNQRLNQINRLKRKYGNSIEEILEYAQKARTVLEQTSNYEQRIQQLEKEKQELYSQLRNLSETLSREREKHARKLEIEITKAIKDLGMKNAYVRVLVETASLSATGTNQVQFLFSPNPGEGEKPLRHIASGGEMSRVMLAIKTVLARADQIPTLVFDEIDAGVGGVIARKLALKLIDLCKQHQVIVITHLPQIAIAGDAHFLIEKKIREKRTITSVQYLTQDDRIREVARLLDGSVSEISLVHARELLEEIRKIKGVPDGQTQD